MSITAQFPSKAMLPAIRLDGVRSRRAAGRALWLSHLALSASGLLPVLAPPLLGYAMIVCLSPG